jgi:hypothetical protein
MKIQARCIPSSLVLTLSLPTVNAWNRLFTTVEVAAVLSHNVQPAGRIAAVKEVTRFLQGCDNFR